MPTTEATTYGRAVCREVLASADSTTQDVAGALGGSRSLVRSNWLAYLLWFARSLAGAEMSPNEIADFTNGLADQLADQEGPTEPRRSRVNRFIRSRIEGYEESLEASKEAETIGPIMNYLIACSATPRLVVRFGDVRPTPACVRSVSQKMHLDASARRQLEEQVAEPKFAYYLPDLTRDLTLEHVLHEASEHVAEAVERAQSSLAKTRAS